MIRSRVLVPVLLALVFAACGRVHLLEPGVYRLEVAEAVQDECGILSRPGALWTTEFVSTGHVVRLDYTLFQGAPDELVITLSGAYLQTVEAFYADGAAFDVTAQANGQDCALDALALHLEATETVSPTEFAGELRIRYEAEAPDRCVCETIASIRGVHQ